ncbi:MAG: PPOX class F420-dependent oxidoreductase [Chloroflexi bacterium]|nr:PPOX class F420-dependent oxidoreductase [Chloroflexota bacterium]
MKSIPDNFQDLVSSQTKSFAMLATTMKDGSPQVTPVWFNWDGTHILINTARGRVKDRNMMERSQVALVIADPQNPYRYLQIRGKVLEASEQGAWEHINELSFKYNGKPYPKNPGEVRVMYKIQPEHISVYD